MFIYLFIFLYIGVTIHVFSYIKIAIGIFSIAYLIVKKHFKYSYILIMLLGLLINFFLRNNLFFLNYGIVISSKENYFILQTFSGRYYVYYENNIYQVFDIIKVDGTLSKINFSTYESQFDFNKYLNDQFVYYQIKNVKVDSYFLFPVRFKMILQNKLSNLDSITYDYASLLFFNTKNKDTISNQIYINNLNYYLSLSSFHLYFLLNFSERFLCIKFDDRKIKKILIFILIFFIFLSNYKLSVVRFCIYRIINYVNEYKWKRKYNNYQRICLLFLILGIINPNYLMGDTFLYTFPLYFLLFEVSIPLANIKKNYRHIIYLLIINFYFITLTYLINEHTSLLSFIYGLLFGPFILSFFVLSLIYLFIPFDSLLNINARLLSTSVNIFDKFNIVLYSNNFNFLSFSIAYLFLFIILYCIYTGRKKKIVYLAYSLILTLIIPCLPINSLYDSFVSFINVGQGDSILIKNKNLNILIDTGGVKNNDIANDTLIPFFKKNQIYHLNYLITTHEDYDHSGAKEQLIYHFNVNNILDNKTFNNIHLNNLKLVNLNIYQDSKDENDASLVLYLTFKRKTFLLMGDASSKIEKKIIDNNPYLKCDYLKVGHHGSSSSTSEEFVKLVKPFEAIISVGRNNYYDHPHNDVLSILKKYKIKIRRTDIEGTITYKI